MKELRRIGQVRQACELHSWEVPHTGHVIVDQVVTVNPSAGLSVVVGMWLGVLA